LGLPVNMMAADHAVTSEPERFSQAADFFKPDVARAVEDIFVNLPRSRP